MRANGISRVVKCKAPLPLGHVLLSGYVDKLSWLGVLWLKGNPASIRENHRGDGEVILISADRFTDEVTKISYYLCRIKLTPEGIRKLGNRNLQPGMPVQVVIKTGERTSVNYLVKPLFDRIAISFKER